MKVKAARPAPADAAEDVKVLADNRKATYDYSIERRIEAGIALLGTEIKSVRGGQVNLRDGYVRVERGQAWLRNVHIAPWANASFGQEHEPTRPRRLLLHRMEIATLAGEVGQKGYTIVPLRIYVKGAVAKVELGLARGKKRFDKRQTIKEREHTREMDAAIRRRVGRG